MAHSFAMLICVYKEAAMGRRDKSYSKTLHQQAYERLTSMQAFGESKKLATPEASKNKIYSFNTYQTYWKHTKYFIKWVQERYPECTTLNSAKKHANEWLQERVDKGLSAWTVQTEAKALGKLYGISSEDKNYFKPPKRNRVDITRSRGDKVRDRHFSEKNNAELVKFCKGTGLRRRELVALKGECIMSKEEIQAKIKELEGRALSEADTKYLNILKDANLFKAEYFTVVLNGKGGRDRISPIIGPHANQIVQRIQNTRAGEKVWQHVSTNADIHGYRGDYATTMYKDYARAIEDIPFDRVNKGTGRAYQSDVYTCRKDEKGRKLDKRAMFLCSKALGHNRVEVVANNYIRGL